MERTSARTGTEQVLAFCGYSAVRWDSFACAIHVIRIEKSGHSAGGAISVGRGVQTIMNEVVGEVAATLIARTFAGLACHQTVRLTVVAADERAIVIALYAPRDFAVHKFHRAC